MTDSVKWLIRSAVCSLPYYGWLKAFHSLGFKVFGADIVDWCKGISLLDGFKMVPKAKGNGYNFSWDKALARRENSGVVVRLGEDDRHPREFDGDELVEDTHEKGTIQSYYNFSKICRLMENENVSIKWCRLIQEIGIDHQYRYGRYYLVFEKKDWVRKR